MDASGTIQGAGGVGGLLSMRAHSGPMTGVYLYCYDGNYNVVGLVNANSSTNCAEYEYGPFGELIRATGPLAKINPFLFSTKYCDWETGNYYYGFRYYNPSTGRWLSRDPLGDSGFASLNPKRSSKNSLNHRRTANRTEEICLHAFLHNSPIGQTDYLGLQEFGAGEANSADQTATWDDLYDMLRNDLQYGPAKACDQTNKLLNMSRPCSSLGRDPEPKLYCGCNPAKIRAAAEFLRHTGDRVSSLNGGHLIGADKLGHCYAFCVASYWYYAPFVFSWYTEVENDTEDDVAANRVGMNIGKGFFFFNPCNCLKACAKATYDMPFVP